MRNKPQTSLEKHGSHVIKLVLGPIETKKPGLVHAGKFMCVKCNRLIKWANQQEIDFYEQRYGESHVRVTYQGFVDRYHTDTHKPVATTPAEQIVYLVATYKDREQILPLGARWDSFHGLYYAKTSNPHIQRLKKYIHEDDYDKCGIKQITPEPIDTSLPGGKLKALLNSLKR